jgi:hypothetical protein
MMLFGILEIVPLQSWFTLIIMWLPDMMKSEGPHSIFGSEKTSRLIMVTLTPKHDQWSAPACMARITPVLMNPSCSGRAIIRKY